MRQNKILDFTQLKKTVDDLHKNGTKALLTMNIFPRNTDIKIFEQTVKQIADVWADAIIFSDPGTFHIIRKYLPKTPLHLSTQSSTMNRAAVKFWKDMGVKRIVFARELHIDEIKEIREKVPGIEIEVFVHGAMCMSYSGRCLLGDYMSGRPGNKGECSHACRFKYKVRLEEERRPGKLFQLEGDEDGSHILSSKDLCTIDKLKEILPYVDAIKIEGRSKSEFYVGAIVKAYKHVRDAILAKKKIDPKIANLVNVIPHREYRSGFLFNQLKDFPEWEVRISDDNKQMISDNTKKDSKITFDIIWAAMKIHNQLWPALLEKVYKKW
jgi:U32 family peptidase